MQGLYGAGFFLDDDRPDHDLKYGIPQIGKGEGGVAVGLFLADLKEFTNVI